MTTQPRIWRFGDDIDTDRLAPFDTLVADWPTRRAGILRARPDFARDAVPGDVLVAGRNFGCGSSREAAAENLQRLGLAAIVARSFGRVFLRNAIALALPCYVADYVEGLEDGMAVELDSAHFELRSAHGRQSLGRWPQVIAEIYAAGGLEAMLKSRVEGRGA